MNLFFVIIIFLFFLILGWMSFKKFLKRQVFYKNLYSFLGVLKTEIGFFKNNVDVILEKVNYSFEFENLLKSFKQDKMLKNWNASFLKDSEKQEVVSFFQKLGRTDVKEHLNEIELLTKFLETKLSDIKENEFKKAKMKFWLIVMLGLLVCVLII